MRRVTRVKLTSDEQPELASRAQIRSLKGIERLGSIYELDVELVTREVPLDPAALLAIPLSLEITTDGMETRRVIHGIAAQITDHLTTESKTPIYRLRFVPRLWRLTLTRTTEIFMNMTVPAVIVAKLERTGLVQGTDFELRLHASYPEREYVVQYDETDLAFVQRLAEHVGITLFFEQDDERERVVFGDHNEAFSPLPQGGVARFFPRGDERGVFELKSTTSTLPQRYVVKDYNYRTPQLALLADASMADGAGGLVYEYGGHFKTPEEAGQLAQIRAEEAACRRVVFDGSADDQRLAPGAKVKLEGHPFGDPELLITRVEHDYTDVVFLHGGTGDEQSYRNTFEAVLFEPPYRPARTTPKPRIHGCITAQIESSHDGPYAELDEEGRYHVRFMFDVTDTERGKATRLVRMAQPHTGPGYGFHFPLRHGVEVLITFIDGDPDRPIISAAVPNPQTPSVVGSNNGTRNIIRTGAGNEINIDDTEGAERIKLSTPYGSSSFQLGAPNLPSAGASLNTSDAWNAVAGSGVTTASTAVSTFADIASVMSSGDIVDMAGASNILSLLQKGANVVAGAAGIADGIIDTAAALDDLEIAQAKEHASAARNEAAVNRSKQRTSYGDAAKYYGDKASQAEREAGYYEAQARSLEAAKKANDVSRGEVKTYTKAAKTAADAVKTGTKAARLGKDAWSKASEMMGKAVHAGISTTAATIAAVGSGLAGLPRIGASVPAPGSPMNIQGAASSACLIGLSNAMVSGASTAACLSGGSAILAGGAKALVKSPAQAEITGLGRCLMTSSGLVDIKSDAVMKAKAGASMKTQSGAAMSILAGAALKITAGARALLRSSANATIQAVSVDVKASTGMNLKAGADMGVKAGGNMELTSGGKCHVEAGGNARIKGAKASLEAGAKLFLTANARLEASQLDLLGSGKALLKGSTVTVKGSTVTVSGSTFKAKGRCLLG